MKIAVSQINPIIGDLKYNFELIIRDIEKAKKQNVELIIFPEMCLIGYPPKDLILKHGLIEAQDHYLKELAPYTQNPQNSQSFAVIVGGISVNKSYGKKFFNSLICLHDGKVAETAHKSLLPTYDVFDETRYFQPAPSVTVFDLNGIKFGLSICEDIWIEAYPLMYAKDPVAEIMSKNAQILINAAASPYALGKLKKRKLLFSNLVKRYRIPLIYVNQVGANDQLIFDGASLVFAADGTLLHELKEFEEDIFIFDSEELEANKIKHQVQCVNSDIEQLYKALLLGLRDYVRKCNFSKVVLGLSGGIDSAVVASLAVDAFGASNVYAVMMPSKYTSSGSIRDAKELADNLGLNYSIIPISEAHETVRKLIPSINGLADENLQARLRANILLALSNSLEALVLSTGNKSEIAVGYCTLYGDTCGALAPIGDVLKTMVYKLADYINERSQQQNQKAIIPQNIIDKAPSAELRENQKDQDTLPPYEILDEIILLYVQEMKSLQEIIDSGFDKDTVMKVLNMIDKNEYKRAQSAPTLKIAGKAFGLGRRMPIAQRYSHK